MPYDSNAQLPDYVKKYSVKIQSQWRYVFNSVYTKVLKDTGSKERAETSAFKAANSVLKKRFSKKNSMEHNTDADRMNMLIDSFLGNLDG